MDISGEALTMHNCTIADIAVTVTTRHITVDRKTVARDRWRRDNATTAQALRGITNRNHSRNTRDLMEINNERIGLSVPP